MKLLRYLWLVALASCQSITPIQPAGEQTELALLFSNNLAADGCTEHIQIISTNTNYKPSSATFPLLQRALDNLPPNPANPFARTITIRFRKTGHQQTLVCGWGVESTVDEIEILEITSR